MLGNFFTLWKRIFFVMDLIAALFVLRVFVVEMNPGQLQHSASCYGNKQKKAIL